MSRFFLRSGVLTFVPVLVAGAVGIGCGGVQINTTPPSAPRPVITEDIKPEAQAAQDEFEKAVDRPPTPKTLLMLAKVYAGQDSDPQAEVLLRRIIATDPKFIAAYPELAELQLRKRQVDEAIKTLRAGLAVSPREAVLLNNLGMCYLLKRDYDAALHAFVRAAATRPDDARYRSNAAMALGMLGRYTEAASLYKQVLPAADVHYNLGVICQARNDTVRAAQEFKFADELREQSSRPRESSQVDPAAKTPDVKAPPTSTADATAAIAAPATGIEGSQGSKLDRE
jgi:predicted Zn-dependent protease